MEKRLHAATKLLEGCGVKIKEIKPGKALAGRSLATCSIGPQNQLDKPPC
ncbi:MAG: hypothetical protein GJT30_04840 [Geobacter sp.]|nr:hypothetical protein [Geobacter sp.]